MSDSSSQQSLVDKVAVVTGGGGGIGSTIARRLARSGAKIIITYNQDAEKAETAAASLTSSR